MNIENNESPDAMDPAGSSETAAPAPKRKPRARKTVEIDTAAAESAAGEPTAAQPVVAASPEAEAAAKPARAPRKPRATKPKADGDEGGTGESASSTGTEAAAPAPAAVQAVPTAEMPTPERGAAVTPVAQAAHAAAHAEAEAPQAPAARAPRSRSRAAAPATGEAAPATADAVNVDAVAERAPMGGVSHEGDSAHPDTGAGEAGEAGEGAEAGAEASGDGAGEGTGEGSGESRRDRGRNRRRGRRGGSASRSEGEAGDEAGAVMALPPDAVAEPASAAANMLPTPDTTEVFASLLSGDFDVDAGQEPPEEAEVDDKRVLAPDPDAPKLHKVLAQSGIGSRRDMEQMIQDGRVSVNGETAHIGMRISFGDRIAIDGKPAKVRIAPPPPRIIAYHKPTGEVVTHDDPQQRPTVFRRLPRLPQGKWQSVGRLDINTEGLLLFTNSGDLANKLMHPRFGVEREYAVRVLGTLEKDAREQLLAGVNIEGQMANFKSVEDGGGEGVNRWYRVVISEGRNREVRKLFDAVGLTVSRLIRVRYGCVVLPRGLKRGVWVDLEEGDVKALRTLTGGTQAQPRHDGRNDSRGDGRNDGRNENRNDGRGGDPRRDSKSGPRPQQPQQGKRGGNEPRQQGADRGGDRNERSDRNKPRDDRRGNRQGNPPSGYLGDSLPREFREPGDPTRIPNPLQQTFDKRAMQQRDRGNSREDLYENGPIPNPLQQTYDKRFTQGQRGGGFGNPNQPRGGKGSHDGGQPDPMKTSSGYIGADAFTRKSQGRGGNRGGRRGGR